MLTKNIWTKQGLLNGTFGTMKNILSRQISPTLARRHYISFSFVLYDFNNQDGPDTVHLMVRNYSPSSAPRVSFFGHNISCSRTQFSITIAYAILFIRPRASRCVQHRRRPFCTWSHIHGHLSSQMADYCSRRVRYCESEEREY